MHIDATLQVSTPAGAEAGSEGGGSCVVAAPGPQQQQQLLLESMERELFEAQAQLQAKVGGGGRGLVMAVRVSGVHGQVHFWSHSYVYVY